MILTCPRCATRYLVDPLQVWATGRAVQCEACGQQWRATGAGVRPGAGARAAGETTDEPSEAPRAAVALEDAAPAVTPEPVQEAPPGAVPLEAAAAEKTQDWHASLPDSPSPPVEEPLTREYLFRKPPPRPTPSFGSQPSGPGRWLAAAFLILIVIGAVVMFRDVIVEAFPGLAPAFASMGLLVHPAVGPHG